MNNDIAKSNEEVSDALYIKFNHTIDNYFFIIFSFLTNEEMKEIKYVNKKLLDRTDCYLLFSSSINALSTTYMKDYVDKTYKPKEKVIYYDKFNFFRLDSIYNKTVINKNNLITSTDVSNSTVQSINKKDSKKKAKVDIKAEIKKHINNKNNK